MVDIGRTCECNKPISFSGDCFAFFSSAYICRSVAQHTESERLQDLKQPTSTFYTALNIKERTQFTPHNLTFLPQTAFVITKAHFAFDVLE